MALNVPQTDPRASYLAHKDAIDAAVSRVLSRGPYIKGGEVDAFEEAFAAHVGAPHAVGVGSGTDALQLALRACGIGHGDEVITVSHTAVATVAAIELAGATPVLVDIDPVTYTLDPRQLDAARSPRTRAIVPVHLYGHPADLDPVLDFAGRHDLRVIEDCAQSHGARYRGRRTGAWGDLAAFSFYPTKNLGAMGDAGMVVTRDADLAARVRLLSEYGWRERYVSAVPGLNSRLDPIQAAILAAKLPHLDEDNERRRRLAATYQAILEPAGLRVPTEHAGAAHVYHQYVLRVGDREKLRERLRRRGIDTLVHYPVPIHLQPAYRGRLLAAGPLDASERAAAEVLSLPMYPELPLESARAVAEAILQECAPGAPLEVTSHA